MSLPTVKMEEAIRKNDGISLPLFTRPSRGLVTLLLLVQVSALLYWRLVYGYSPIEKFADWTDIAPSWVHALAELQWLIRIVQLGAFALLAYIEYANQGLSKWLRAVMSSSSLHAVVICLSGLLLFSYFLQPGNIGTGDAHEQIPSAWVVRQSWNEGQWFVFWTNYAFMGGPQFQFHNSAFYYFVAMVSFIVPDFQTANELALLLLYTFSAYFTYLLVLRITGSRTAALVGMVAWSASYYHYHLAIALARLPASMFTSLLPCQFYLIEEILHSQHFRKRMWAALAFTTGLLFWTHSLYGSMAFGVGLLYALARTLFSRRVNHRQTFLRFSVVLSAYLAALPLALYQIAPISSDWSLISLSGDRNTPVAITPAEGLTFDAVLKRGSWDGGFIGNSIVSMAMLGVAASVIMHYRKAAALIAQLALLCVLQFSPGPMWIAKWMTYLPLGNALYRIAYYRPEMYLMPITLTLAALAGILVHLVAVGLRAWRPTRRVRLLASTPQQRIGLIAITIILWELLPLTITTNEKYPDDYVEATPQLQTLMSVLDAAQDKTRRVIHLNSGANPSLMIPLLTGHPSLFGNAQDNPGKIDLTLRDIWSKTTGDAQDNRLSPKTAALLYQANIGYIITDSSVERFEGLEKIAATEYSILWRVPESSPMELTAVQDPLLPPNGRIEVIEHDETNNTVHIEFYLPSEAYVQLAYTAYPYQRVVLDGQRISVTPTRLGLIGFEAQSGRHVVEIAPELSPLRQRALAISAVTSLLLLAVVLAPSRKKQL